MEMKIIVVAGLMGREHIASMLIYEYHKLNADYILLLGNIVSPTIIDKFVYSGARILGINGNLDDHSVIKWLKKHDAYLSGKIRVFDEFVLAGIGVQVYNDVEAVARQLSMVNSDKPIVIASFYPPTLRPGKDSILRGSAFLNEVFGFIDADFVIVGVYDEEPFIRRGFFYPGWAVYGYYGIIDAVANSVKFSSNRLK